MRKTARLMMKQSRILTFCLIVLACVCLLTPDYGTCSDHDDRIKFLHDTYINGVDSSIRSWNLRYYIGFGLTLMVGILGVVMTVLQKYETKWARQVTAVLGASISIVTVVINTAFDGDYRSFKRFATKATAINIEIKDHEFEYKNADKENRDFFHDKIKEKSTAIFNLEREFEKSASSYSINFINSAFAAEKQEPTINVPDDENHLYFLGISENSKPEDAENESNKDAKDQAIHFIVLGMNKGGIKVSEEKITDFLQLELFEIYGNIIESNKEKTGFTSTSLLRVNRKNLILELEDFGHYNKIDIPKQVKDDFLSVKNPQRVPVPIPLQK